MLLLRSISVPANEIVAFTRLPPLGTEATCTRQRIGFDCPTRRSPTSHCRTTPANFSLSVVRVGTGSTCVRFRPPARLSDTETPEASLLPKLPYRTV